MFAKTQMPTLSFAFPDVCKFIPPPAGPGILPLPNISLSATSIPNILNQFICGMPVHNLMTNNPISLGNEVSIPFGGGVVSSRFLGSMQNTTGSFRVFRQGCPATKMLDVTMQNGPPLDCVGVTLTPSQLKVLHFS